MKVVAFRGVMTISLRINAPISPACSASPTPTMTTKMIPTGPKFRKFRTADVKTKRMPSAVRRLLTVAVRSSMSWVCGLIR